jgi:hypothetical protein
MDVIVDKEAVFADLRARGVPFEGDEAWHLEHEAARLRQAAERRATDARLLEDEAALEQARMDASRRLQEVVDSGDDEALLAELSRQLGGSAEGTASPSYEDGGEVAGPAPEPSAGLTEIPESDEELTPSSTEVRLTWEAFSARNRIRRNKKTIREFSRRVWTLRWKLDSTPGLDPWGKKFPFLHKDITTITNKEEIDNKKIEAQEVLPRPHLLTLRQPMFTKLPAWKRLPAEAKRPREIQEIIAGARFTSIAFSGDVTPSNWWSEIPGHEVCCLSIDLPSDAASRFLAGEHGDVGAALHRNIIRRLDRDLGGVEVAAVWVRPPEDPSAAVRLFLMIRAMCKSNLQDVEVVDRCKRFHRSLVKHGVKFSSDGPLWVSPADLADYLGLSVDEFEVRSYSSKEFDRDAIDPIDIEEFTPEAGFASSTEIDVHAAKSHAKWLDFVAKHGLPSWFSARIEQRLKDCFLHAPQHVRERQRLKALRKDVGSIMWSKMTAEVAALKRYKSMEAPTTGIRIYRGSPAQFAALIAQSGELLGSYCDTRHKAGAAKDLYEQLRA